MVYRHIGFAKMRECYGMWFTRAYWTDYNIVEFASWAAKACIIVPGLIFGISIILIYIVLGTAVTAIFGEEALNNMSTNPIFNLVFFIILIIVFSKVFSSLL